MYAGSAELAAEKRVRLFHSAQQQEKRKSTYNMQSNVRLSEGEAGAFKGQSAELKQKLLQNASFATNNKLPAVHETYGTEHCCVIGLTAMFIIYLFFLRSLQSFLCTAFTL